MARDSETSRGKLSLVLSGGGARGAYEAGVIYYLRTALPKRLARRPFPIQVGSSVGAINTLAMASLAEDPLRQAETIKRIWLQLRPEHIYRRDLAATVRFVAVSVMGILGNLLTVDPYKLARRKKPRLYSFLDTQPLRKFLGGVLPVKNLSRNIRQGPVDAVALVTTNLQDGSSEIFWEKKPQLRYLGSYRLRRVRLGLEHALASAAIPIIFPPVKIDGAYYSDGGLRMFTPMSPAIQLGAKRLLIVQLQHHRRRPPHESGRWRGGRAPTFSYQLGRLLGGMFQDRLEFDLEQLEKINRFLEAGTRAFGPQFLPKINRHLKKTDRAAGPGLRSLQVVDVSPHYKLSDLFRRWFARAEKGAFEFSAFEKLLIRFLDIDPVTGQELLSYLIFAPDYLKDLFEVGYQDARRNRHALIDLLEE